MDQDLNDRLTRIEKMVGDNNRMLVKMRKAQKNAAYVRAFYWIVVIILAIISFYFIKPYLSELGAAYGIGTSAPDTSTTPTTSSDSTSALSNLLKQYEAEQKTTQ